MLPVLWITMLAAGGYYAVTAGLILWGKHYRVLPGCRRHGCKEKYAQRMGIALACAALLLFATAIPAIFLSERVGHILFLAGMFGSAILLTVSERTLR